MPFLLAALEDALEPYEGPAPAALTASDYLLYATRPGYLPTVTGFAVEAGASVDVNVPLERSSSVIHLRTTPADTEILIDGIQRRHGAPPTGAGACHPPGSCSAEHRIEGLPAPGRFDLEVAREGFRSYRAVLQLPDLRDYELPKVTLEREEAVIAAGGPLPCRRPERRSRRRHGRSLVVVGHSGSFPAGCADDRDPERSDRERGATAIGPLTEPRARCGSPGAPARRRSDRVPEGRGAGCRRGRQRARQIFRALASAAQGRIEADGGLSAPARARLRLNAEDDE